MRNFFGLIRFPNLLMIVFTQLLMRYAVIIPMLEMNNLKAQQSTFEFLLLIISTVFIAAAGYIINDYFDVKIDRINKPKKVVLDKQINRKIAMIWHFVLTILGIFLGFYVSWKADFLSLGFIFPFCSLLLWVYSINYKRQLFTGNLIVSLLTALVPFIVFLYEIPNFEISSIIINTSMHLSPFLHIFLYITIFTVFAFLTSIIREIIKDSEDMEGDKAYGCKTVPIVLGLNKTKILISVLAAIMISILGFIQYRLMYWEDKISFFYILIFIQIPLAYLLYYIWKAYEKKQFKKASLITKLIMLTGILYAFVIYFKF